MELTRTCKECKVIGPTDSFASAGIKNGKQYYRYLCKYCFYKSKKPRKADLKQFVLDIKKNSICERCSFSDYRALQFHHLIAEDKYDAISNMVANGYGKEKLLDEIKKCAILCANCHQIEHFNQDNLGVV